MPAAASRLAAPQFDRVAATLSALVVVGLAVFLLIRNQPIGDARLFFVLRVVLSFAAATLGATIPGFLNVRWAGSDLVVRAGGALALFVLTYVYTPDLVTDLTNSGTQINQSSSGDQSPPIANNSGKIIIKREGN